MCRSLSKSTLAVASSRMTMGASFQNTPRNGNALFFTARKGGSAFADDRIEPLRQVHDKVIATRLPRCLLHFLFCGGRPAHRDVVIDGVLKQVHALEHHADFVHKFRERHVADVHAPNLYTARLYIPETGKQVCKRGFSSPAGADERGHRVLFRRKADAPHGIFLTVGKGHVFKRNFGRGRCRGNVLFAVVGQRLFIEHSLRF